jgi:hypothetical protein
VKVFDGASNALLRSFFAYGAGFTGGVYVAAGDLHDDGIVQFEWDLNNDGVFEGVESSPAGAAHTFAWNSLPDLGPGTHPIRLRVTDDSGLTSVAETTLTIVETAQRDRPVDSNIVATAAFPDHVRMHSRMRSHLFFDRHDDDARRGGQIGQDHVLDWFFAELGRDTVTSTNRRRRA